MLLPWKTLAHVVSSHVFMDYFQHSTTFARDCCEQFDLALWKCYANEFLPIPTPYDIKRTAKIHQVVHGVCGMFRSLDCTHTYWKKCAKGWTGSYSRKEHKPSIVLEAIVDHHTFWHASYGYAGSMNDMNIFNVSPFKDNLMNGVFNLREDLSGVVPYKIGDEEFVKTFILVDAIYCGSSPMLLGVRSFKNCLCSYDKSLYFGSEGKVVSISGITALKKSSQNIFASGDNSIP
ncbi:hypothetical protein ACHAW6_000799 [Cyclotella cf. meneghiniana]